MPANNHYKIQNFNESIVQSQNKSNSKRVEVESLKTAQSTPNNGAQYKVQLFATSKKRNTDSSDFNGLNDISYTFENKLYKYYFGLVSSEEDARKLCELAKGRGFNDAFIVTF